MEIYNKVYKNKRGGEYVKMRNPGKHVRVYLLTAILMAALILPSTAVFAAPRTGTYEKHFVGTTADSYRTVVIKKMKKNKVVFQIQYARSYPFRESWTEKIVGRRKGNKVVFSYREAGWNFTGTGVMKLKKNAVKIKTSGTPGSDYGFISTGNQTFKLKRVSSKKKFAAY